MGALCSCCGSSAEETNLMPSPETRRRQQVEAVERRRLENEQRGLKNPAKVRQQQLRSEELQRREQEAERLGPGGAPTLKFQPELPHVNDSRIWLQSRGLKTTVVKFSTALMKELDKVSPPKCMGSKEINVLILYYVSLGFTKALRKGELGDYDAENVWRGMWFPQPPDFQSNELNIKGKTHTNGQAIDCDNGKNVAIDYDPENKQHSYKYLCLTKTKQSFEPNLNTTALLLEYYVPPAFAPSMKCLNETLIYEDTLPTYGSYRPMAPKFGTYRYLPPQRWLHSLADGAIVLLYHPCAFPGQVKLLRDTLQSSLYRHIVTPSQLLQPQRPMALLAWGKSLEMSVVDERIVLNFIKDNAKRGMKHIQQKLKITNNYYDIDLLHEAHLVTNSQDSDLFDI